MKLVVKTWFLGETLLAVLFAAAWIRRMWRAELNPNEMTAWAGFVYEEISGYGFGEIDHWREEDDPDYIPKAINRKESSQCT